MQRLTGARHRIRQGVAAILARPDRSDDELAGAWLLPGEGVLFRQTAPHDRAHSRRVAQRLLGDGEADRDLIAAALLHDLAKSGTAACPGWVRLPDRVLHVFLGRFAPAALRWLSTDPDRPGCRGLYLAVHHARLGAAAATVAGSSERTAWLIAHHEDAARPDTQLRSLIAADDASH